MSTANCPMELATKLGIKTWIFSFTCHTNVSEFSSKVIAVSGGNYISMFCNGNFCMFSETL